MFSPVTIFSLISSITTSISNHDIQPSLYGLAIFASKVMDIFSHALSVFLVKHEIKKNHAGGSTSPKMILDGPRED